eukprot:Filipodium_phascolosomae@DN6427_c0_g1_i1.p1
MVHAPHEKTLFEKNAEKASVLTRPWILNAAREKRKEIENEKLLVDDGEKKSDEFLKAKGKIEEERKAKHLNPLEERAVTQNERNAQLDVLDRLEKELDAQWARDYNDIFQTVNMKFKETLPLVPDAKSQTIKNQTDKAHKYLKVVVEAHQELR